MKGPIIFSPLGGLFDELKSSFFGKDDDDLIPGEIEFFSARTKNHDFKAIDMHSLEKLKKMIWKRLMKNRKYSKYAKDQRQNIKDFIEDTYHSSTMFVDERGNNKRPNPQELYNKILSILDKYMQQDLRGRQ